MGPLASFFGVTFAVSWTFFLAAVALARGTGAGEPPLAIIRALVFFGTIAPGAVAFAFLSRDGRGRVLDGLIRWRVDVRWYVFAVSFMAIVKLAVLLYYRIVDGVWLSLGPRAISMVLVAIVFSTPVQAGEEIGWRGFALPRLT